MSIRMDTTSFSRESVLRTGLTVWGWPNLGSFMASFSLTARPPISMCSATSSPVITCSCAGVTRVNKVPLLLKLWRCPSLTKPFPALFCYQLSILLHLASLLLRMQDRFWNL